MNALVVYMIILNGPSVSVTPDVPINVCEEVKRELEADSRYTYRRTVFCVPR